MSVYELVVRRVSMRRLTDRFGIWSTRDWRGCVFGPMR